MALFPRIRLRALMLHVRDTLRTGINAPITAAQAESPATAPASNLETIANTTTQIELGDHPDYEPLFYPSIRIANPRMRFVPFTSATVTDTEVTLLLGIYTEEVAGVGECAGDTIKSLTETTLDLVECVRACLEEDYGNTTYGDRLLCIGYERVEAPQDPEAPCVMRMKYEMTIQIMTRARQSKGATT